MTMWERIDGLLERGAPHYRAVRFHRLELLDARRRRAAGLPLGPDLEREEGIAAMSELALPALLERIRSTCDGDLVLIKGAEVAVDYPGPRLRRFGDVDLLASDAAAAQAALLAAGFVEVGEAWRYENIHHLRALWWPGLPLIVEIHDRPKWPDGLTGPPPEELVSAAVPSRVGVDGIGALPAAEHALLLAAHAWAHEPLGRLGQLVDVGATLQRTDPSEVEALARRRDCLRMWKATHRAVRAVLEGEGHSLAVALWARQLRAVRERSVFEMHLTEAVGPVWAGAPIEAPRALRRLPDESWGAKLGRSARALANARVSKADHDVA
jgi:Uncharacterised nucleotidyltransferase